MRVKGAVMMSVVLIVTVIVRYVVFWPVTFGVNFGTGAPDLMVGLLSMQDAISEAVVIVAKANCGIPGFVDGEIHCSGSTTLLADYAEMARNAGARIIGGCCGTTPDHVRAMRQALETRQNDPCPAKEEVIAAVGPLTGKTEDLLGVDDRDARPASDPGATRPSCECTTPLILSRSKEPHPATSGVGRPADVRRPAEKGAVRQKPSFEVRHEWHTRRTSSEGMLVGLSWP